MMVKDKIVLLSATVILFSAHLVSADTVYLKNGGSIEGIIEKEDEKSVEMDIGFGTITFYKTQIREIRHSSAKESYDMANRWAEKREELKAKEKEFAEARDKRFKDAYNGWMEEARKKELNEEAELKHIQIARDDKTRSIMVEALLNETVKANLVLDTGASLVVVSRQIGETLGIDFSDVKKDIMELRLADGRRVSAKAIVLDSVRIQDVEVKKVMAAIMLDQIPDPGLKDGLLGMSFLNRFNLKMDLKSMKMSLEKIIE